MYWLKNNMIYKTIADSYRLLTPAFRRRSILIIFSTFTIGLLDFFGLAAILPVIYMASNISVVYTNKYLNYFFILFNFSSPQHFLLFTVWTVFILFIFKNVIAVFLSYLQTIYSFDLANNLSERKFSLFYKTDFSTLKDINSSASANEIDLIPLDFTSGIMLPLLSMFSEVIVLLLIIVSIAFIDIKLLLLLSVLMVPVSVFFYRLIRKRSSVLGNQKLEVRSIKYKYLYQNIHGYTDAVLSNKVKYFLKKFFAKQKDLYNIYAKLSVIEIAPARFFETAAVAGIVIIFSYSIFLDRTNSYLIGFLTIFATAAYRMLPSLNRIFVALVRLKSTLYVFDTLNGLPFDSSFLKSILSKDEAEVLPTRFDKNIAFKNISFSYKGMNSKALNDVSFEIKKGEIVGFIGTSGSGKTTLFNILLRLLQETNGEFLIDGRLLQPSEVDGWRQLIGYVRQDYYLLDTSLAENIAFGIDKELIDEKKVWDSIEKASLASFIKSLPEGIHSIVGEKGGKLSGGQKQRIAIARALYHNSEIILFDEATSALDNETENEIIETINNLFAERKTMLMIAHRYTTLKKCDRIFEMKDGKIISVHKYDELIRQRIQV